MALPIRDGNQSLTTLSTIIVNSAHVPAHSVVSLGSQAITDISTAVSGVELGPNTISALENIAVTFGVGASVTIGNVVSVTGGLTDAQLRASSVTIGGSVQVSNFPATQAVTFTQAPVTFSNIAGSVTAVISGTPSVTFTQASVTFTQASVTFGQAVVSASNISLLNDSVATEGATDASIHFIKIGGHQDGSNQIAHVVHVSAGGAMKVDASGSTQPVTFGQTSVTFNAISGSVSVLNFPATQTTTFSAITGSVSVLNFPATQTITFTQASVTFGTAVITGSTSIIGTASVTFSSPTITGSVSVLNFPATQTIAGTVTADEGAWTSVSSRDWASDQSDWFVDVSQYASIMLSVSGDSSGYISGGHWTYADPAGCNTDPVAWNGNSAIASIHLADCNPKLLANTRDTYVYFSNVTTPSFGGSSTIYGKRSKFNDGLTNSQLRASPVGISGTVTANAPLATVVTLSNFTSATASSVLVSANSSRKILTVFNEGSGNLHISAGSTSTTLAYQVRLSAGDYWECQPSQTTLTHSAQFASSGTARVVEIS